MSVADILDCSFPSLICESCLGLEDSVILSFPTSFFSILNISQECRWQKNAIGYFTLITISYQKLSQASNPNSLDSALKNL